MSASARESLPRTGLSASFHVIPSSALSCYMASGSIKHGVMIGLGNREVAEIAKDKAIGKRNES